VLSWLTAATLAVLEEPKNVFAMSTASMVIILFEMLTETIVIISDGRNSLLSGFSSGAGISMLIYISLSIL
jgi:hypothetical protein